MFQKLFSSPILAEWASITTTRCVYLVSYNFYHWNHWNMNHLESLFIKLMIVPWLEIQWNFPSKKVLNARHLKPPEVHRGTLSEKMGRASRLRAKSNINMTRSLHTTGISIYVTMFNINITRSQKNLDWVKSKFASLKANIHTQVNKSLLQQMIAATKFQQLFAATK